MPRYEFSEGKSDKFWDIALDGKSFTTRWGRIGTAGQSTTKTFASAEQAKVEHDKLVAEKVRKGYRPAGAAPAAPVASGVAAIWARIEAGLKKHKPEMLEGLKGGATAAEIGEVEKKLGVAFPAAVRESYSIHNGQDPDSDWLVRGRELLSLDRVLSEWGVWKGLLDGGDFKGTKCEPAAGVRDDWWSAKWIPLTYDGAGNHDCVDLDPAPGGAAGQMILMWHDDSDRPKTAPGFAAWLEKWAGEVEKGEIEPE